MNLIYMNEMSLYEKAEIVKVNGNGPVRRKILEMGLLPGSEVEMVRKAPLGDPVEFRVKGYSISLRKSESELIQVKRI